VVEAADQGRLLEVKDSPFFKALNPIVDWLLAVLPLTPAAKGEPGVLKFALPVDNGKLSERFGHASHFALITTRNGVIAAQELAPTPAHEPGGLPEWLDDLAVTHVIAAGLGEKAQKLLIHKGIEVIAGAPQGDPEELVQQYLQKTMATGANAHAGCGSQCTTA
jgi:predicted Fe-Mo cluster-binding NifX family protein